MKTGICLKKCYLLKIQFFTKNVLNFLQTLNKLPIWNLVPYVPIRQLHQRNSRQVALEEQHQKVRYMKKLQGQQGALLKAPPSPESHNERSLIQKMKSDKEILQYLKESPFQDIVIYAAAIKKCSELKYPNSIIRIIEIVQSKHIHPSIIFYNTALNHLGIWNKFDLQKHYFQQWFEEQNQTGDQLLVPTTITFNTMIKGCAKRGDFKQALYYLHLMIDKYNIQPDLITCNSSLSVCANAHDIQSAELIWNKMIHEFNVDINIISINSILNVYAKCGDTNKMMEILNYSQRPEKFIPINEIACTTIISGFLKANKVQEMFDFYDNQIPKLALDNNINLQEKFLISLKSVGHLKMMETLDKNEIEKLSFHHQKILDIFENELYPDTKFKPTSILLDDIGILLRAYILLNKRSWMKAVKDVERILFQEPNYIHPLNYWEQDALDKNQILLNFNYFSTTTTCFILRYLMTFQRQELKINVWEISILK
ncbi:pentatricopeptide (PPR) repeat-containing protein [Reticulomyxa filosa]|uniref:Pentatricopeptide (PPR) repeat-containing protein n=1 Tax=Reticulomyxa filosa TaxID=46433 RepID=X6LVD9_RETFI|nr:pentatricopeptide (PPR) repeat-containing protein [Reticulomyxa filosa]|eukprot:ETO05117.1 pentatricopeptide (PPR) repeat-containing protein [Reticulomyxa filosa]